jgi:hypothetical protein
VFLEREQNRKGVSELKYGTLFGHFVRMGHLTIPTACDFTSTPYHRQCFLKAVQSPLRDLAHSVVGGPVSE